MTWDTFEKAATVAGALGLAASAMWYVVGLEGRIGAMESKLQALAIAPALSVKGGSAEDTKIIANPMLQVCADLARKVGELRSGGLLVDAGNVERFMETLACFPKR